MSMESEATKKKRQEGRYVIAEFMGMKKKDMTSYICWEYEPDKFMFDILQYDTKWDWLMPVVDKINDIYNQADEYLAPLLDQKNFMIRKYRMMGPPIHAVFEAIVTFINWYNLETSTWVKPKRKRK